MNTETSATPVTPDGGDAQQLSSVENLIKTHLAQMNGLKEEAKKHQEMIADMLINDPQYSLVEDKAKEATKAKNVIKQELLKAPQAQESAQKIKTLKSEVKEHQEALSTFLQEYQRLSGNNQIEGDDGEWREIIYSAKLVKIAGRW